MSKKRRPHDKSRFRATLATMNPDTLEPSLRDPVSGQALRYATPAEVSRAREALGEGASRADDASVPPDFDGLAISEDGRRAYPIVDGLVYLLPDNQIMMPAAESAEPPA